jgi:diguanylate cyclase (GGDEF)-like protein
MEHACRYKKKIALLFLDLDYFKCINDSLGHPFGDEVLKGVARRVSACARAEDTVARLGGDEFALILGEITESHEAAKIAQRILNALSKPFTINGHKVITTFSVGISLYPDDAKDSHNLLKKADTAMYYAKKQGRNTYQFHTPMMTAFAQKRLLFEKKLHLAVAREEFVIHYQPQVTIKNREFVGLEALVHWKHPEMGLICPETFIPIAEETGLINSIEKWLLYSVCMQSRLWQLSGDLPLRIAVHLSSSQFREKKLVKTIGQILKDSSLDPQYLELQIVEKTLMEDLENRLDTLQALKDMGIYLSISKFGTGYFSMRLLKHCPIDRIKIDRSFIDNIPHNPTDVAIVNAIIAMAHSLDIEVVAEGVDLKKQLDFLGAQQCDAIQGDLISRPVPSEELTKLLNSQILVS